MSLARGIVYSDGWQSVLHWNSSRLLCRSGENGMYRVIQEKILTFWEAVVLIIM